MRNLTTSVSEEKIRETFECHGRVERVKKIKDYAFVHFEDRKMAVAAMQVGPLNWEGAEQASTPHLSRRGRRLDFGCQSKFQQNMLG